MINPLAGLKAQKQQQRRAEIDKALLHFEARIGGQIFGEIPAGRRREFFCLDEHTWIWHEEWKDESGNDHTMTTRYDIRPDGVLKSQGSSHQKLKGEEAKRFYQAARLYIQRVQAEYVRLLQAV